MGIAYTGVGNWMIDVEEELVRVRGEGKGSEWYIL